MFLSNMINYIGDTTIRTLYAGGPSVNAGLSRILNLAGRSISSLVFQQGKPILDAEMNAMNAIARKNIGGLIGELLGSSGFTTKGAVGAASGATAFDFGRSVLLFSGQQAVNVAYSNLPGDLIGTNRVGMNAKPGAGTRDDLVFLELWYEEIEPTNSAQAQSKVLYVEGGSDSGTLTNELYDAAALQETTRAIQLRWKIRVVDGVDFITYPKGVNSPTVKARGSNAVDSAQVFSEISGMPGLFVAGTGLAADAQYFGSVEGHTYAVPLFNVPRTSAEAAIDVGNIISLMPGIKFLDDIYDLQNAPAAGIDPTNQAKINRYELSGGAPGLLTNGQTIMELVFAQAVTFPDDWAGSKSKARVASTGPVLLNIYKNGVFAGSISYNAGNLVGGFNNTAGPISFAVDDVIRIDAGASDPTLANVVFTLVGSL